MTILTIVLELVFILEPLLEALKKNTKETLRLFTPVLIILGISCFSSYLPSFIEETVVAFFLYQMTFAIIIIKLMLHNMSGRAFSIFHVQYVYLLIPLVSYFYFQVSPTLEMMITRSCMACALLEFLFMIYRIAKQYVDTYKISFFTIKDKQ